jgi:hypothetical protein
MSIRIINANGFGGFLRNLVESFVGNHGIGFTGWLFHGFIPFERIELMTLEAQSLQKTKARSS